MQNHPVHKQISVPIGNIELEGELILPYESNSLVIFSHGSGSSRFSSRNIFVAQELHKQNISTFLFDLLTKKEDEVYANRFNIELLSQRLAKVTNYICSLPQYSDLEVGYFGASTGAASALYAAVSLPEKIKAIVSRGGRPDLAMDIVPKIKAPTLLIVGGSDLEVLDLNKKVYNSLTCEKKLEIVPGATHLFEEPGKLEQAALLAVNWFKTYLENKKIKKTI